MDLAIIRGSECWRIGVITNHLYVWKAWSGTDSFTAPVILMEGAVLHRMALQPFSLFTFHRCRVTIGHDRSLGWSWSMCISMWFLLLSAQWLSDRVGEFLFSILILYSNGNSDLNTWIRSNSVHHNRAPIIIKKEKNVFPGVQVINLWKALISLVHRELGCTSLKIQQTSVILLQMVHLHSCSMSF